MDCNSISSFEKLIREISLKKEIFIFGAGVHGKILGRFFNQVNIKWLGFIDNNIELYNLEICDKKVYPLDNIYNRENVVVLISLSHLVHGEKIDAIKGQLKEIGVNQENILYFGDSYELINDIIYFINKPQKVLLKNKKLKNIFQKKRCFIIGNGPSLRMEDLYRLTGEVSMGCNGIIYLTNNIEWRPTCFFCEDSTFIKNHIKNTNDLETILEKCNFAFTTLKTDLYKKYSSTYDKLFYLRADLLSSTVKFSEDISERIYSSGTTLYSMFQVAVYMGIKEIYLLGVDFSFRKERYSDGKIIVNDHVKNHMELLEQHTEGVYNVDLIMEGYKCFRNYANNHGIKVYNATRGGKLDIFERVDFDSLF